MDLLLQPFVARVLGMETALVCEGVEALVYDPRAYTPKHLAEKDPHLSRRARGRAQARDGRHRWASLGLVRRRSLLREQVREQRDRGGVPAQILGPNLVERVGLGVVDVEVVMPVRLEAADAESCEDG